MKNLKTKSMLLMTTILGIALASTTKQSVSTVFLARSWFKALSNLAQTGQLPEEIFDPAILIDVERLTSETYTLCEQSTTTIEACITAMKADFDNDWPALDAYFDN